MPLSLCSRSNLCINWEKPFNYNIWYTKSHFVSPYAFSKSSSERRDFVSYDEWCSSQSRGSFWIGNIISNQGKKEVIFLWWMACKSRGSFWIRISYQICIVSGKQTIEKCTRSTNTSMRAWALPLPYTTPYASTYI